MDQNHTRPMAGRMRWSELALALLLTVSVMFSLPVFPQDPPLVLSHEGAVSSMAFRADGEILATLSCADPQCVRREIRRWELASGREIAKPQPSNSGRLEFDEGGSVRVVRESLHPPRQYDSGAFFETLSPDGQLVATGGERSELRLWNASSQAQLKVVLPERGLEERFLWGEMDDEAIEFSPDRFGALLQPATTAAVFSPDQTFVAWVEAAVLGMGFMNARLWFSNVSSGQSRCRPVAGQFSSGRLSFIEIRALAIHPIEPIVAVAVTTPGPGVQSRIGEVQLLRLPECF